MKRWMLISALCVGGSKDEPYRWVAPPPKPSGMPSGIPTEYFLSRAADYEAKRPTFAEDQQRAIKGAEAAIRSNCKHPVTFLYCVIARQGPNWLVTIEYQQDHN